MKDFCIILMFDKKFLTKAHSTISSIRQVGEYTGDIVCIIGDDLKDHPNLPNGENVIIKHFPDLDKTKILGDALKNPKGTDEQDLVRECFTMGFKFIHYHKFYCFHTYFRDNYRKCLYIDTGMYIGKPLKSIINVACEDKFLAHSDAYPSYHAKLSGQFDKIIYPDLYEQLDDMWELEVDYFQATTFMFDTKLIQEDTFELLVRLANLFINSRTNDQGILNLYFNCMRKKWQQLPIKDSQTHYYDFFERGGLTKEDYIMVKYPRT